MRVTGGEGLPCNSAAWLRRASDEGPALVGSHPQPPEGKYLFALEGSRNQVQKTNLRPNWIFLAPKVEVDLPKSESAVSACTPLRLTRLNTLKNSVRN